MNRPGAGRPSSGQLNDFLSLPGHVDSPARLPANGNRPVQRPGHAGQPGFATQPGQAVAPGAVNRPNVGQQITERPRPGDRPTTLPAHDYENVRNHWQNRPNPPFDRNYWQNPAAGGRWYGAWARQPAYWAWTPATFTAVGSWLPYGWNQSIPYDYGTSITYQEGNVYQGDQLVASAPDYAEQANTIALSVPEDVPQDSTEWLPLGVFAIAEEGGKDSGMVIQLAVSKEGIIAGSYYNDTSDNSRAVEGMVDRDTQRAAWKFADGKQTDVVFETGISNLTKDEAKCLVHFGPDKTQTWTMVRVPSPTGAASS